MRIFLFLIASSAFAADLSGTWELIIRGGQITDANRVQIAQKDGAWVFSAGGMEFRGVESGDSVRFECREDNKPCGAITAKIAADSMTATGELNGIPMTWTARRPAARPTSPARHEF